MDENKDIIEILGSEKESSGNTIITSELWINKSETSNENSLENLLENVETTEVKKEILSISITSLEDISKMLINNAYDYANIEPIWESVVVKFMSEEKNVDGKVISYPLYSNILIQAKTLTSLKADNKIPQEWDSEYKFDDKNYRIFCKTFPWNLWEKLIIKLEETLSKKAWTSAWQVFAFIWALIFIWLILWWTFITFTVMNAKTLEDVIFFRSLWIDLNEINSFIAKLVTAIFSSVIFCEIILFSIFWIKFLLSKKILKKRRIIFWLLASSILFITFLTWSIWMYTIDKVNHLPDWPNVARWDVQLYDNTKLLIEWVFNKDTSLINDYSNLIWPVTIRFDLSELKRKEENKANKILKYIWNFWNWKTAEELSPITIREFSEKWTYDLSLIIEEKQADWKVVTKPVENIPSISINNVVKINQETSTSWWKKVTFDARDLNELWKVEWYMWTTAADLAKPKLVWNIFTPGKVIFWDTMIWLYIKKEWKTDQTLDKVFLISSENWPSDISWEIKALKVDWKELSYDFYIKNPKASIWDWFIEEYKWIFWNNEKIIKVEAWKEEESSKIRYDFIEYWEHIIKVEIKTTSWKIKVLSFTLNLIHELKVKNTLKFYSDDKIIDDVIYESARNEYYLHNLQTPTILKIDAKLLKLENPVYSMQQIKRDTNNDWNYDEIWSILDYKIDNSWKKTIWVEYTFRNLRTSVIDEKIKEKIYIDAIRKEAIIDLEIIKDNDYAPITVKFDASKSEVAWENIVKFIYNYGDWEIEERDALNLWHRYNTAWEYNVWLTIVTETWKRYSITKKLILKPEPQLAKARASLKKVKSFQWVDFSSSDSKWQIISYFWDFWDDEISTEANPTHYYKNPWEYTVKLKIDFINNNTLSDSVTVNVVD